MLIRSETNFGASNDAARSEVAAGDPGPKRGRRDAVSRATEARHHRRDVAAGGTRFLIGQPRSMARRRAIDAQRAGHAARAGHPSGQCVSSASPSQREALLLHYWEGCSLVEIAEQLDRTTDAVGGLLKRGLQTTSAGYYRTPRSE